MTLKEFQQLKPGDKVQIKEVCDAACLDCLSLLIEQKENDGYLIVKEFIKNTWFTEGLNPLFSDNTELYEEPSRPWSYERDY
jgi:hypothetical protein